MVRSLGVVGRFRGSFAYCPSSWGRDLASVFVLMTGPGERQKGSGCSVYGKRHPPSAFRFRIWLSVCRHRCACVCAADAWLQSSSNIERQSMRHMLPTPDNVSNPFLICFRSPCARVCLRSPLPLLFLPSSLVLHACPDAVRCQRLSVYLEKEISCQNIPFSDSSLRLPFPSLLS